MKNMLDELKKLDEDIEVPENFRKNVMKNIRQIDAENKKLKKRKYFTKYIIPYISSVAVICIAVLVGFKNSANKDMNMASINQAQMDVVTDLNDNNNMISGHPENSFSSNSLDNSGGLTSRYQSDTVDMKKNMFSSHSDSISDNDDIPSLGAEKLFEDNENGMPQKNNVESVQEIEKIESDLMEISQNTIAPESALKVPTNDFISNICEILKSNDLEIVYKDSNYVLVDATIEEVESLLDDEALNVLITGWDGLVKVEEKR